jgi:2-oxoglutarate ferredoxin oxidoreductase subunit delta
MQVKNRKAFCKGCNICVQVCPSKVFEEGSEVNEHGYFPPKIVLPEKCPNFKRGTKKGLVCEMCILTCPDQALSWDDGGGGEKR